MRKIAKREQIQRERKKFKFFNSMKRWFLSERQLIFSVIQRESIISLQMFTKIDDLLEIWVIISLSVPFLHIIVTI